MNGSLKGFTNPTLVSNTAFSFSAMGDTHIGSSGGNLFSKALLQSLADGDSFAVTIGDNSNTGFSTELQTFNSQAAAVGLPVYPAIGNHDIFFGGWANYKTIIGRSIYSFSAGIVHIVMLDTANGTFGIEQLNWLKDDLSHNSLPLKVVIMHYPVYVNQFSSIYKLSSDEEATIFKNIMHQFGVQLVISGHYHGSADANLGDTRYLVTGGCNTITDPGQHSHYVKVIVQNGQLVTRIEYLN
jgi:3',5'-cyclic AMP phosphodiesterase CpdA